MAVYTLDRFDWLKLSIYFAENSEISIVTDLGRSCPNLFDPVPEISKVRFHTSL